MVPLNEIIYILRNMTKVIVELPQHILLHDYDFPTHYKKMAHPEDYIETVEPVLDIIYYSRQAPTNERILARVSWKLDNNKYLPMTFVCDTGACSHFYLSEQAMTLLQAAKRLYVNEVEDLQATVSIGINRYVMTRIERTPGIYQNANVIGLRMLKKLGLTLTEEQVNFSKEFRYL
jgi:hypothetical protein